MNNLYPYVLGQRSTGTTAITTTALRAKVPMKDACVFCVYLGSLQRVPSLEHHRHLVSLAKLTRVKANDALVLKIALELSGDATLRIASEERSKYCGLQYVMCVGIVRLEDMQPWVECPLHDCLMHEVRGGCVAMDMKKYSWLGDEPETVVEARG
ncbi:hypothetical protein VTO73DRAFT_15264 [Trametes versicolor]